MFLINNKIRGINLKREKLVRLKLSKNEISISAPQNVVAPAWAYIITTQIRKGFNVYILLKFSMKKVPPIFFEFHKNPVSDKRAQSIVEDAISFVEDMGFEMIDSNQATPKKTIIEWVEKLGVFYLPFPSGSIELQVASESIVADGKSQILIESQPIFDSDHDTVTDETEFEVSISQGLVVDPLTNETANPKIIRSRSGFLTFAIQASTDVGLATINVKSKLGNASGVTRIIYVPGNPAGKIILISSNSSVIANGSSTVSINSKPIKDDNGNMITDETEFIVTASEGNIINPTEKITGKEVVIKSRGSGLKFLYKAGTHAGSANINVISKTGTAKGTILIELISGTPSGKIDLKPGFENVIVDDKQIIPIKSNKIYDSLGNLVSNNTIFIFRCNKGTFINEKGSKTNELKIASKEGMIACKYNQGTKSGKAKISVFSIEGDAKGSCFITIRSDLPEGKISIKSDVSELMADGKSIAKIFSPEPIKDKFGNLIENDTPFAIRFDVGKIIGLPAGNVALSSEGLISFEYLSPTKGKTSVITCVGPQEKSSGSVEIVLKSLLPVGNINMTCSHKTMTANDTDECEINSDVVLNTSGSAISDGTLIELEIILGNFIAFDGASKGNKVSIRTIDGVFTQRIRVGKERGTMMVTAKSHEGTATGEISIPILAEDPEGTIELQAEQNILIADGKSFVWITSLPITDTYDNIVDDGTLISIECDHGEIIADNMKVTQEGSLIPTRDGIIRFKLKSVQQSGRVQITALSVDGFAMGTLDLTLISGVPSGDISLETPNKIALIAYESLIKINSSLITDRNGNTISDNNAFIITAENGFILEKEDSEALQQLEISSLHQAALSFLFKAGKKAGEARVNLRSKQGDAHGSMNLMIEPGLPASEIILHCEAKEIYANLDKPILITSDLISDTFDNVISDKHKFKIVAEPAIQLFDSEGSLTNDNLLIITPDSGVISFYINSEFPNQVSIAVEAEKGTAKGSIDFNFLPQPPAGKINLIVEEDSLVADSESQVYVESEIITTVFNKPVPDGTAFTLIIEEGVAYVDDLEQAAGEIELHSENGKVFFYVIAGTQPGKILCNVKSIIGEATGKCNISLLPGPPAGEITFQISEELHYAASPELFFLESDVIMDKCENPVIDGTILWVDISGGELQLKKTSESKPKLQCKTKNGKISFYYKAGKEPDMMLINVWSEEKQATGSIQISLEPPPLQDNIVFTLPEKECKADGKTIIELQSEPIKDIFENVVSENIQFTSELSGTLGFAENVLNATDVLILHPKQGKISFQLLSPEEDKEVIVRVSDSEQKCLSEFSLHFLRPVPQGKITFQPLEKNTFIADGETSIAITTEAIKSDRDFPVLDGELFEITSDLGTLSIEKDIEQDKNVLVIPAKEGVLSFNYKIPTQPGKAVISVKSQTGTAIGELELEFIPGPPSGHIKCSVLKEVLYLGDYEPIEIISEPMFDNVNNKITDEWEFVVTVSHGIGFAKNDQVENAQSSFHIHPENSSITFFIIPEEKSDKVLISVECTAQESDASGTITLNLEAAHATGKIILIPQEKSLIADGKSTTIIESEPIKNLLGNNIDENERIIVSCDKGSLAAINALISDDGMIITPENGIVSFSLRASKKAGTSHLYVKSVDGDAVGELDFTFVAGEPSGNIVLNANPIKIPADGVSETTISSNVITDANGNQVKDETVILLETDMGEFIRNSPEIQSQDIFSTTLENGFFKISLKSITQSGVATVMAWSQAGNAIGNLEIFLMPGFPHGEVVLLPSIQEPLADGHDTTIMTSLPIKDVNGNYISDDEEFSLTITTPDGEVEIMSIYPKNSKLEFKVSPQTVPGQAEVVVESNNGEADGHYLLNYQSLFKEEDDEEEWFFAESEDNFILDEANKPFDEDKDIDELQLSIENSFSKLINDTNISNLPKVKNGKSKISKEMKDFYNFLAGF